MNFVRNIVATAIILFVMVSCASSRIIVSNNANIDKYKYVIIGNESSGDRELDDVVMDVHNYITETNLIDISSSNSLNLGHSDYILTPNINVSTEKWDGGHTYITVTFYDYYSNQIVAVVKSSGIGMSIRQDQNIALRAIRKKLYNLFGHK